MDPVFQRPWLVGARYSGRFYVLRHLIPYLLLIGHAIRYAAEIGMHRAIPKLFRRVKENRVDEGSFDQSLIMFARVWCALYTCGT